MDADPNSAPDLGDIRREIDEIDAQLLELLHRRFAASERVRVAKLAFGGGGSPVRPAREASLMHRLMAARRDPLPLNVMISIWRHIISSSTLLQADATVNVTAEIASDGDLREMLRGHFGCMPLVTHDSADAALAAVSADPAAMAVLPFEGGWPAGLAGGPVSVTGVLPFLARNPNPELAVLSQAPSAATGQDETLILSQGQLPRDFAPAPLWRAKLDGGCWITSLPGYLSLSEMPLVSLTHGNDDLALRIIGRYPSPITID